MNIQKTNGTNPRRGATGRLLTGALLICIAAAQAFAGGQKADNRESGGGHPGGLSPQARQGAMPSVAEAPPEGKLLFWHIETRNGGQYLIDLEGNDIPLRKYERMVILSPGAVETLFMIGGEGSIAAIMDSRDIPPVEKTSRLKTVGNSARPSLETIIAAEPDLVLGNAMNSAFIANLRDRGLNALIHGANSVEDIFNGTIILGRLSGREEAAAALAGQDRAKLSALKTELEQRPLRLKGAILYSANPPMAFTGDSLAGEVLELLGVENIAAGLPAAQPILSTEYLLVQNPDFLFGSMMLAKPEDILAADSAVKNTRAGREGNLAVVPSRLFLRPSPSLFDGILELRETLKSYEKSGL
ncbi:MAG: ABC transporter substrate-binding protein [Treponema sp.]|jgi:iron complex transport system substrate-binding protein|nr:ABC transporter substrate-binding protein [Treponema sp.]